MHAYVSTSSKISSPGCSPQRVQIICFLTWWIKHNQDPMEFARGLIIRRMHKIINVYSEKQKPHPRLYDKKTSWYCLDCSNLVLIAWHLSLCVFITCVLLAIDTLPEWMNPNCFALHSFFFFYPSTYCKERKQEIQSKIACCFEFNNF